MKKYPILLIMAFIILGSCNDDTESIDVTSSVSDVASFSSHENFEAITNKIPSMSKEELDEWEQSMSFLSYRSILDKAYIELEAIDTEESKTSFLKKYQDVLTLQDDALTPLISIPLYQAIVNREGIYETNGYLNKVVGDFIVSAKKSEYQTLKSIKSIDINNNTKRLEKEGLIISRYAGASVTPKIQANERVLVACSTEMVAGYYYNRSGCGDDRKVDLSAKSYVAVSTSAYGNWYQPRVKIQVLPTKRLGTWCTWVSYNTPTQARNIAYSIMAFEVENGFPVRKLLYFYPPDFTSYYDYPVGSPVMNFIFDPIPFSSFYGEATSQGVGDNWAILECQ
ncbi:hypothetical protein [Cesiribacter sp. SM1]|uniref:hypothetical protein n=1 Tax=Cesiribacter sp. SM1 TaxID=2861196 RepID=UPI001CD69DE1|nr:hypothetical protein [Cesiribacter sp. SM1]